jgi:hypothetical protein
MATAMKGMPNAKKIIHLLDLTVVSLLAIFMFRNCLFKIYAHLNFSTE